ncbi:hypothetical protein [Halogranum rubrum]|nr:hypothetical protein [Halogranum rubrum]
MLGYVLLVFRWCHRRVGDVADEDAARTNHLAAILFAVDVETVVPS